MTSGSGGLRCPRPTHLARRLSGRHRSSHDVDPGSTPPDGPCHAPPRVPILRDHYRAARRLTAPRPTRRPLASARGLFVCPPCEERVPMSRTEPAATPLGDTFHVFDTTLRDGAQREGISYSVADKLAVARHLDALGVGFIEGGWPGALPKDTEFFARAAAGELALEHAALVAFGATRKAGTTAAADPQVRALLASQAPVVTLVAKSDRRHIERALRTDVAENCAMVADT